MQNKFIARSWEATGSLAGAIALTWAAFLLLGGMPLIIAIAAQMAVDPDAVKAYLDNPFDLKLLSLPRMLLFTLLMANFVIAAIGMWVGAKWIAKQRFFTLITGYDRIRWGRMAGAALLWIGLMAVYTAVQYLITPAAFVASPDAHEVPWWILPGILLVPIQSGFEEVAVRGQLMQAMGKQRKGQNLIPLLVTSFIFALLHGLNTEVSAYGFMPMMLQYLVFGLFLGAFALMDEGLELSIGIHVGNNLFSLFVLSYEGSSVNTPSLFHQIVSTPTNDLFGLMLMFFIFFLIHFGRKPQLLRHIVPARAEE